MATDTGKPVVGEVKVEKDKNPCYALIQVMTYAVELSTSHQLTRLQTHYGKHFTAFDPEHPEVDIAIILVNPDGDNKDPCFVDPITKLVKEINDYDGFPGLGRATVIRNSGEKWEVLA